MYAVIFKLTDLIEANEEAINDICFWIKSIRAHAVSKRSSEAADDKKKKHATVILIGTHYDRIKTNAKGRSKSKNHTNRSLQKINNILCPILDIVPKEKGDGGKELCYWPVDNIDREDPNTWELRKLLVGAIIEDPLGYINDPIPISWLKIMDELVSMSNDEPLLQLYSSNRNDLSIVGLMHKFHAVDDIRDDEEACIKRSIAFMNFGHQIRAFVYFDSIPGLQGFCILNPQWILDTMTYIIRDVKLHRFRRDYNAMKINDGESWKNLMTKGILDLAILRKLWLGEEHCVDFLANLMVNLGLFGTMPVEEGNSDQHFLVPGMMRTTNSTQRNGI